MKGPTMTTKQTTITLLICFVAASLCYTDNSKNNTTSKFSQRLSELKKGLNHKLDNNLESPWPESFEKSPSSRQPSEFGQKSKQLDVSSQTFKPQIASLPTTKSKHSKDSKIKEKRVIKRVPPNKGPISKENATSKMNLTKRYEYIEKHPKANTTKKAKEVKADQHNKKLQLETMGSTPATKVPFKKEKEVTEKIHTKRRQQGQQIKQTPLKSLKF